MAEIAIIGAGPAGLIAAEYLSGHGHAVTIHDRMPSVGRKFLMAGRGGLNLTHSEPLDRFIGRYGAATSALEPMMSSFTPEALRKWCESLGQETFIGSSGRVFPKAFKASPLLRAWLGRLAEKDVTLRVNSRWTGWTDDGRLRFQTREGEAFAKPAATLLALGGASWPRLGSDGAWSSILADRGIAVSPLRPANCGFTVPWSQHMTERFAGAPLKRIAVSFAGRSVRGEAMITEEGIEGGAIYALADGLREAIAKDGSAVLTIDLRPDIDAATMTQKLAAARKGESFANRLRKQLGLPPVAVALLHEADRNAPRLEAASLAGLVKALPVVVTGVRPIDRAISTAGGVAFAELTDGLMLKHLPGVFCAGEMLDWEAPTGGYLLQGCFATGIAAAKGIGHYLS